MRIEEDKAMLATSVNSDYHDDLHDWEGEYMYSKSEMFQARDILSYYGLKAHTIHAT